MREKRTVIQNQTLPVIALRGLVLFPKMVLHFDIGREKSIAALNQALEEGRKIFLTAQSDIQEDDPHDEGLYRVGVIAEIKQVIRVQGTGLGQDPVGDPGRSLLHRRGAPLPDPPDSLRFSGSGQRTDADGQKSF